MVGEIISFPIATTYMQYLERVSSWIASTADYNTAKNSKDLNKSWWELATLLTGNYKYHVSVVDNNRNNLYSNKSWMNKL